MNGNDWSRFKNILNSAVQLSPGERERYLSEACGGDDNMRRELNSFLDSPWDLDSLLEDGALGEFQKSNSVLSVRFAEGTNVNRYQIREPIGRGGMGVVYLAEDMVLHRNVALKVLPPDVADKPRLQRFEQEARAASALNHPNILTIHETGEFEGMRYIVSEFVNGTTLREKINTLGIPETLDVTIQIASALEAAHRHGIVHRDVKPENVMIREDGIVKVLDFGLAKLTERRAAVDTDPTMSHLKTTPGVVMGTVSYMSPEQARGGAVDSRTDIFSLGLVLFESLTHKRAFERDSQVETLNAIINEPTPPSGEFNPAVPFEAQHILDRALAKDLNERYQHIGDMRLDLVQLKRSVETDTGISFPRSPRDVARRARLKRWLAGAAAAIVIVGLGAWLMTRGGILSANRSAKRLQPGNVAMMPLTADVGYEGEPTFAPDGERIAYVSDRNGNLEIYLKQISGGPDINLTNDPADDAQPAFSPDGKQIAFVSSRASQTQLVYRNPVLLALMGGDIWVMSALGGAPKKIAADANFPTWSADGTEVIYISGRYGDQRIYRVPAIGGNPTEIETRIEKRGPFMAYPSVSKNGTWIAFESQPDKILVVPASGGDATVVARGKHPVWNPQTDSIIYSNAAAGTNFSLWQIPFSTSEGKVTGEPEPLTLSKGRDMQAAVSQDGRSVAFSAQSVSFNIESNAFDPETGKLSGPVKEFTVGNEIKPFFDSTPDGRSIVFESNRGSASSIWRTDGTSPPTQLTSGVEYADHRPVFSPDGTQVAFVRRNPKKSSIGEMWVMDADGANPRFLTEIAETNFLEWHPSGRGIFYYSDIEKQAMLYDFASGTSRQVTNEDGVRAGINVSSDGKWLFFQSTKDTGSTDIRAMPVDGGESRTVIATPREEYHPSLPPSGRWFYFQFDHKNIYRIPGPSQNWRTAEPERITNLPETNLYFEDSQLSADGRTLFYSHGRIVGDIWLITMAN